jgi:hypothetical protein
MGDYSGSSIVNANALDELLRRAEVGRETVFDLADEGGATVKKIAITHQALPAPLVRDIPEAAIARALARQHTFNDIPTLAAYIKREHKLVGANEPLETLALANVDHRVINVVLDDGSATDREVVSYRPITHPLFAPWEKIAGKTMMALDFAKFVMENRRAISGADGRETAMIFQQLRVSTSITMNAGTGKRALNGVMVETVIQGQRNEEFFELPEEIQITVPIYCDSEPTTITFDLTISGDEDGCMVTVTASDLEKKRYDAFQAMVAKLAEDTNIIVGLGKVESRSWVTVRQA